MTVEALLESLPDNWTYSAFGDVCRNGGGDIQTGPFGSQLHKSDYVPLNEMDSGSAIPSTSRNDFYQLPVIVPPDPVQSIFDDILTLTWEQQRHNRAESRTLAQTRDLLLLKLMSDEIRLREAERVAEAVL